MRPSVRDFEILSRALEEESGDGRSPPTPRSAFFLTTHLPDIRLQQGRLPQRHKMNPAGHFPSSHSHRRQEVVAAAWMPWPPVPRRLR
jgi:hypothetical protein